MTAPAPAPKCACGHANGTPCRCIGCDCTAPASERCVYCKQPRDSHPDGHDFTTWKEYHYGRVSRMPKV